MKGCAHVSCAQRNTCAAPERTRPGNCRFRKYMGGMGSSWRLTRALLNMEAKPTQEGFFLVLLIGVAAMTEVAIRAFRGSRLGTNSLTRRSLRFRRRPRRPAHQTGRVPGIQYRTLSSRDMSGTATSTCVLPGTKQRPAQPQPAPASFVSPVPSSPPTQPPSKCQVNRAPISLRHRQTAPLSDPSQRRTANWRDRDAKLSRHGASRGIPHSGCCDGTKRRRKPS